MAKRRQTTGLPKTRKRVADDPTNEYKSHTEREAAIQKQILLVVGTLMVVALLVVAFAFIKDEVIDPAKKVATVNGHNISVSEFEKRVRFERLLTIQRITIRANDLIDEGLSDEELNQALSYEPYGSLWIELGNPDQMGLRVINDMINDYLIREEAERMGITVNQEEIDKQIAFTFNFDPNAGEEDSVASGEEPAAETETPEQEPTETPIVYVSPTPSPVPTATQIPIPELGVTPTVEATIEALELPVSVPTRTFAERSDLYDDELDEFYYLASRDTGMSREEVNAYFETKALRIAVGDVVVETRSMTMWVNTRHILVTTEGEALDIIDALNVGESFSELARAHSLDTGTGAQGGEFGWVSADLIEDRYSSEYADTARVLGIGEISAPVQSDMGFHIIQVHGREDREMSEYEIEYSRQQDVAEWMNGLKDKEGNEYSIDDDVWINHVPVFPAWSGLRSR